jgi:hypothetical protein
MPLAAAGKSRSKGVTTETAAAAAAGLSRPNKQPNPFVVDPQDSEFLDSRCFSFFGERLAAEQYGPGIFYRQGFSYQDEQGDDM